MQANLSQSHFFLKEKKTKGEKTKSIFVVCKRSDSRCYCTRCKIILFFTLLWVGPANSLSGQSSRQKSNREKKGKSLPSTWHSFLNV